MKNQKNEGIRQHMKLLIIKRDIKNVNFILNKKTVDQESCIDRVIYSFIIHFIRPYIRLLVFFNFLSVIVFLFFAKIQFTHY